MDKLQLNELLTPWGRQTMSVKVFSLSPMSKPTAAWAITSMIARAGVSIHIACYIISSPKIWFWLDKQNSKIEVKVIHDSTTIKDPPVHQYIRYVSDQLLHAKVVIADRRLVYLGSHNLTGAAFDRNYESGILIESKTVADEYAAWIESLWKNGDKTPVTTSTMTMDTDSFRGGR